MLYVLEEGFEYYGASAEENIFVCYRKEVVNGEEGYIKITVDGNEENIIVLLEATDEWGE